MHSLRRPVFSDRNRRSYWLQSVSPTADEPEMQSGKDEVDIAIVGGGLTGLWTALRIKEYDPSTSVTVIEAGECGSGASGRNGGQLHSWHDSLDELTSLVGFDEAVRLAGATSDAIDELKRLENEGEIDVDLRLDGWLWTASSPTQEGAWRTTLARSEAAGRNPYEGMDAGQILRLTGSDASYSGLLERNAGSLHPGKLVKALRSRCKTKGVTIFEYSTVTAVEAGTHDVKLHTDGGWVKASRTLLATNAWTSAIPEVKRKMYVVDSQVLVTEPVPERLDDLGWKTSIAICDSQRRVLYYRRTPEGRVVFGRGTGSLAFNGRVGDRFNNRPDKTKCTLGELTRVYPSLRDVRVDYEWVGPIDCVSTKLPMIGSIGNDSRIMYCAGWNGTALAQTPVVGRVIASRLLERDNEWAASGLVNEEAPKRLPGEPIRYLGGEIVRRAIVHTNKVEQFEGVSPKWCGTMAEFEPSGVSERWARGGNGS